MITCPECKRIFKYSKSFNKHLHKIHPQWLNHIEDTPFDLTPNVIIPDVMLMEPINAEAMVFPRKEEWT